MADLWKDIAARKQKERSERIPQAWLISSTAAANQDNFLDVPRQCGILTTDELRITENYDATALVQALASRRLTSVEVVTAFCKRAAIAQQLTNCLTEILFDDALARAKSLDEHLQKYGKPVGPLHGLPISMKDTFNIKSYDASIGIASLCFKPARSNSALVDLLLAQGAVLYCKTNVPQTMMALDSHNYVYGRTLNPSNKHLTAGGSSGGEGALVAMRGSPLGVGTDVGGSIRIPALCNGVVGFKPSHGRVPYAGQEGGNAPGSSKLAIEPTAGPIARNVRDAELLLRVIAQSSPNLYDPEVIPQSWQQQTPLRTVTASVKALRVGIARTDGHTTPLPPIQRLMEEVSQRLRSSSLLSSEAMEVFDIDISSFGKDILKTFNGIVSIDGANNWFDLLEPTGEPLSPWLSTRIRRREKKSLEEIKKLQGQRLELQTRVLDIWKESGGYWSTSDSKAKKGDGLIDVLICPAAPHPVAPIDRWNTANYTAAFNLLDYPAGVLPVRTFQPADLQGDLPRSPPLNGWDKINRELWTRVDRKVYLGSPLSIQVVAPKLMDRKLVEAMAVLERALAPLRTGNADGSKL
ncbi:fatty-acid amide hydrolase like protein [Teratosphaeria destructans]|uniref:amidase n=1 Tax=Teratosphaeria destructans TaxID=418781 RepID=A0A9W7SKE6_9PEZI|nr:fatty-acid amide hydrolase like protein [Teratosphaeria destructans]